MVLALLKESLTGWAANISICVTIGKWSIFTGLEASSVSHLTSVSISDSVQNTLSTLVWLPVFCARSVGIAGGSAIFMLCWPSMSSNGCVSSRFLLVNRWAFLSSSHSR